MRRVPRGHSQPLFEVLFVSGDLLATGDGGGNVYFWNALNGRLIHRLSVYRSQVRALAVSSVGSQLATASFDMEIAVFGIPDE